MKKISNGDNLYHTNDFHFLNSRIEGVEELNNTKLKGLKDLIDMQFSAMKVANELAATNLHVKLEEMNRFREENKGLRSEFLSNDKYNVQHEVLRKEITEIKEARLTADGILKGKADANSVTWLRWGFVITSLLTLTLIVLRFIK